MITRALYFLRNEKIEFICKGFPRNLIDELNKARAKSKPSLNSHDLVFWVERVYDDVLKEVLQRIYKSDEPVTSSGVFAENLSDSSFFRFDGNWSRDWSHDWSHDWH